MTEIKFFPQASLSGKITNSTSFTPPPPNSLNLINVQTAKEVGEIAKKEIGSMPFKIATAGYSAPPEGYEESVRKFLKALDSELGVRSTAFITSPTADKGSIDAITSEITGLAKEKIFYTTAKDYIDYINPKNFPSTIDTTVFSKIPKYILPDAGEYSKATAEASNVFIATGGRNATVSDFVNAIKKGNKSVILDNPSISLPAWGEAKCRVENASKYLLEQLEAFKAGKSLPHPEIGEFTKEFLSKNGDKIAKLVKLVKLEDASAASILKAAKDVAKFLK